MRFVTAGIVVWTAALLCLALLGSGMMTAVPSTVKPGKVTSYAGAAHPGAVQDTSAAFPGSATSHMSGQYGPRQLARVLDDEKAESEDEKDTGARYEDTQAVHEGVVQSLLEAVDTLIRRAVNAHGAIQAGS